MSTNPRRLGKYELQELRGRGGTGEVWKAFDTQLQRHVAIKLLHTHLQDEDGSVTRFEREAQVIASLHHPNIVQIFDFQVSQPSESENTIVYMVMDYIEGQTLAQYIRNTSRLGKFPPAADLVYLFTYISLAIDHAHKKGMIHRDIKPSNILLDKRHVSRNQLGQPVLTDFGIAKLLSNSTTTLSGWWFGTPLYTSPEQAQGSPGNERSDLYSLGIILYEICTGILPFQGDNATAILMQHIDVAPISPSLINPHISPALSRVILRSIAKEPMARFSNAIAMAAALAEALDIPVPEVLKQSTAESDDDDEQVTVRAQHASAPPGSSSMPLVPSGKLPLLPTVLNSGQGRVPAGYSSTDSPPLRPHLNTPILSSSPATPQEQQHFLMQEYIGGENLEERLKRLNHPLEEWEVLTYASQILETLEDLAQQVPPVVHGNIKPANIVISTRDKKAHLVGFNVVLTDNTGYPQYRLVPASGTRGYAPMEQLQGHVDPRSDLYALAATMHHLLTNRNPRNNAPFFYPLARTINPRLSTEVELLLVRALLNDVSQRYQSATEMKRDIDDMLKRRQGISANSSNVAQEASDPPVAEGTMRGASASLADSIGTRLSGLLHPPESVSASTSMGGKSPVGVFVRAGQPFPQQRRSHRRGNLFLILALILLVGGGLSFSLLSLFHRDSTKTTADASTGIGVFKASDGEYIGVSDGTTAFDTNRPGGDLMSQAAAKLKAGDVGGAETLWQSAWEADTGNAEPLIYLEDQRVLASGYPYITLVVGTIFDASDVSVGQGDLQGAYMAQREYNAGFKLPGGMQVRLLIANSGNAAVYATNVAQQIVQMARTDKTIVGVMGWPYSSRALDAINVLAAAHIPMVSETATSVLLTGISPYFFRVVPPDSSQAAAGARYAEQTLHARSVALFDDPTDAYSKSLGDAFRQQFTADGNSIVAVEQYTVGKPATLSNQLQDALSHNPDLIYFAGYSKDVTVLLTDLPTSGKFADLQVMGGDGLYVLSGYTQEGHIQFGRLRFTAFAYPDEWDILGLTSQKPTFFREYPQYFNPNNQPHSSPYGYTRTDSEVMLAFDATFALLEGCRIALSGGKNSLTSTELRQALATITGAKAIQGVSGQIAFGPDGNPINKAVVVLSVTQDGYIQLRSVQGKFLTGS
jgi:eukaryotic-like serine/threonine-protein kinase